MELFKRKNTGGASREKDRSNSTSRLLHVRDSSATQEPQAEPDSGEAPVSPGSESKPGPDDKASAPRFSVNNPMGRKESLQEKAKRARARSEAVLKDIAKSPAGRAAQRIGLSLFDKVFPIIDGLMALYARPETKHMVRLVFRQAASMAVGLMLVFFGANFSSLVSAYNAFMNVGYEPFKNACLELVEQYKDKYKEAYKEYETAHTNIEPEELSTKEKAQQRRERFLHSVRACEPESFTKAMGGFFSGYVNVIATLGAPGSPLGYVNKGVSLGTLLSTPLEHEVVAAKEEDRSYRERLPRGPTLRLS